MRDLNFILADLQQNLLREPQLQALVQRLVDTGAVWAMTPDLQDLAETMILRGTVHPSC